MVHLKIVLESLHKLVMCRLQTLLDCLGVIYVYLIIIFKILLDLLQQINILLSELQLILHVVKEFVVLVMVCIPFISLMNQIIFHLVYFLNVLRVQHVILL